MIIQPLHREGSEKCAIHGSKGWSENFKNRMSLEGGKESPSADNVAGG